MFISSVAPPWGVDPGDSLGTQTAQGEILIDQLVHKTIQIQLKKEKIYVKNVKTTGFFSIEIVTSVVCLKERSVLGRAA
jgi:hypothetical protein